MSSSRGYWITHQGQAITCRVCGLTSHHPKDVQHRYCGKCHIFHEDEKRRIQMDVYEKMLKFGFADMSPGPPPTEPFVVKVQRPPTISPNMPDHFLVYNEERSVRFMANPEGLAKLSEAMGDQKTAYFWAEWQGKGNVHINTRVPCDDNQDW